MNRTEFEALRDLPGKVIRGDIRFTSRRATAPLLVAENLRIDNDRGVDVRLDIHYNPEIGSKTFNVTLSGTGPVCRLDIDGPPHRPAGRCHKHSLQTERCPDRNLRDGVIDRQDLAGGTVRSLFTEFCAMSSIQHEGELDAPDEGDTP
ncbi:MAG: hypothetical protein H7338_19515 [Candidatus Sericytochromatia bacterium]|nr:hypothetical protein [Candidatus Sericytochromatia bacterium]